MELASVGAYGERLAAVVVPAVAACATVMGILRDGEPFDDELMEGVRGAGALR